MPGIERPGVVRYALHRSYAPLESAGRRPGVLVTPTFETEGLGVRRYFPYKSLENIPAP
ncbi:hypothetical protein [Streptomyces sp. MZ04]|uniref:hypothetical protein n=1 Tax=Streptomyces sp. MZ04 TaxID=2559236 RepID=UPI001432BDE2|nr:hypothetical protein [Streptomyces sp. MZ04]